MHNDDAPTRILPPRILIVDDSPSSSKALRTILRADGYRVDVVRNGVEALKALDSVLPDLILLDTDMPEMDGYEACERIQASDRTRGMPIIFFTARAEKEDILRGLDLGAVDYITKPCDRKQLLSRIRTHVEMQELRREAERRAEESSAERDRSIRWTLLGHATPAFADEYAEDARRILAQFEYLTRGLMDRDPNKTRALTIERLMAAHLARLTEIVDLTRDEIELECGFPHLADLFDDFVQLWTRDEPASSSDVRFDIDVRYTGAVHVDRQRMLSVLRRVVDYAVHLRQEHDPLAATAIELVAYDDPSWVYVAVQSSGAKIPVEWRESLFDADHEHTGEDPKQALGLYYASRIVGAHGGAIGYGVQQGKSAFIMRLPKS